MSLLSIEKLSSDVTLGIWRIDEEIEQFAIFSVCPRLKEVVSSLGSKSRQSETLAVYSLLYAMTGDPTLVIGHTPQGRPLLDNYNISISHTRGFAAVILSRHNDVAVDIEYISDRVDRITSHFMRTDEPAATTVERLVIWCAKETLYKYHSAQNLRFSEMRVHMSGTYPSGSVRADNLRTGTALKINYNINQDFIITYAY